MNANGIVDKTSCQKNSTIEFFKSYSFPYFIQTYKVIYSMI
jgi:hypothetical protein